VGVCMSLMGAAKTLTRASFPRRTTPKLAADVG
jgi:hypothetical protein